MYCMYKRGSFMGTGSNLQALIVSCVFSRRSSPCIITVVIYNSPWMCSKQNIRGCVSLRQSWGWILGRNPDKSLQRFPPCYWQSPLQLALRFFISSNSRNLLCIPIIQLMYTVKEKGGKTDRKPYPLSYGLRNPYRNLKSENSQDYAQKPQ